MLARKWGKEVEDGMEVDECDEVVVCNCSLER